MKKIFGNLYNKFLLSIVLLLMLQGIASAYETIIMDFPQGWQRAYHDTRPNEAITQYLPNNQTRDNYNETLVFHSYKWELNRRMTPLSIIQALLGQVSKNYSDMTTSTIKNSPKDDIAIWCSNQASQCEIIRVTQGYEGIISMHYINKNVNNFKSNYTFWLDIITHAKIYYSYYRWNLMLDKPCTVIL